LIYMGHFMSSWGDRMWYFAIPLFLTDLDPKSLFLTAAYGLTLSASVLLFAPLVGDWIDRTGRLTAVKVTLVIQNMSVIISALILLLNREFGDINSSYLIVVQIAAVILGAIGTLASTATQIILQKDWIVVIAAKKTDFLTNLNATMRRIDLFTKILSPIACGQIMALATLTGGAVFILCWNTASMFGEYILLRMVYKRTPDLAIKRREEEDEIEMEELGGGVEEEEQDEINENEKKMEKKQKKKKKSVFQKVFGFILVIKDGWKLYTDQVIALAGLGFSFLYLTVLGFGYVTTSYAYNQCFSELLVGIVLGAAGFTGILGTFVFPLLSARFGLVKSGLFSGIFQVLTLIPCVASVFVAGSPFFLLPNLTVEPTLSSLVTQNMSSYTTLQPASNFSETTLLSAVDGAVVLERVKPPVSFLSMWLLTAGLVAARAGLWSFDLAMTQLIQENVIESERGIVNGVQTSLNMLMDLLMYVAVLILPDPDQFGILIILSAVAVTTAYVLYAIFAIKSGKRFDQPKHTKVINIASVPSSE
uniref:Solute carrier family 40 member n=1 Tax=Ciona intestinalis TaxID=7719 RepID=F6VXA3_CIOIN